MSGFDWVMSEGGPLICLEEMFARSWGGISRLTVEKERANNDYERCDQFLKFVQLLELREGQALIFGEGPLDTSFWRSSQDTTFIIRIFACEPEMKDDDFDKIMSNLDENLFDQARESISFKVSSSRLIMFDSANDGTDIVDKTVSTELEPGLYEIRTQTHDPDPTCSLVLHRFDRVA